MFWLGTRQLLIAPEWLVVWARAIDVMEKTRTKAMRRKSIRFTNDLDGIFNDRRLGCKWSGSAKAVRFPNATTNAASEGARLTIIKPAPVRSA